MLLRSLLLISFCLIIITNLFAQKQANRWYFGDRAGLNFSGGNPVAISDGVLFGPNSATISDENGNYLFCTNGYHVYDRNHQLMAAGLNGATYASQNSIIIPQPGNDSIYFIFTCDGKAGPNGINYSTVNMKKRGGLGDVVQMNTYLIAPVAEKISAVKHCNGKDYWVLARGWGNDKYFAWLVSSGGVNSTPVISSCNININVNPFWASWGCMKISPDGKKVVAGHFWDLGFMEVSDFNAATGVVSNTLKVNNFPINDPKYSFGRIGVYGIEFSPDSKMVYTSPHYQPYTDPNIGEIQYFVFQFQLTNHNIAAIEQSRVRLDSGRTSLHGSMQLGTDDKIYVSDLANLNRISVINNPNIVGNGCDLQLSAIPITSFPGGGTPNFISSYFGGNTYNYSFNNNCSSQNVSFQINNTLGYSSIKWDFGDVSSGSNNTSSIPNPTHNFTTVGIYEVKLIVNRNNNACAIPDTIKKSIWVGNVSTFLGVDTTICEKDTITLQVNAPGGVSYLWSNNTTSNSIRVTNPGNYSVTVNAGSCTYTDDINITQQLLPRFSLGNDAAICSNASVTLQPIPAIPNGTYLWNTNAVTGTITVNTPGMYWLRGKDHLGCTWRDTVQVAAKQLPNFNLGKDTAVCEQQTVTFNTQIPNATYLWSTGATSQSITASAAGIYWADVTKDGCKYRDSIELAVNPFPVVSLGKDSTLCEGQTLLLNALNAGASYVWQDNSAQPSFTVTSAGNYHIRVTHNGCVTKDTIKVDYNLKPRFTLGADKIICPGETVVLQPNASNLSGVTYLWQNGTALQSFSTNQAGLYFLLVTNNCGTTTDSIILKDGTCKIYVPNAFTPDGNNLNDAFKVLNTEAVTEFEFIIFNRWGQIVFQTTDKQKGWDGRMNSTALPAGTYPWTLKYKETGSNDARFLKGQVLLIR